jgi:hypothetical protein
VAHSIAPGLTENLMGKQAHKTQMEDAPLAKFSPGSVREPMATGTDVSGGRLQQK